MIRIKPAWAMTTGGLLTVVACAVQPGETSLKASFAEQIVSLEGVADFGHNDEELTFSGPDGRGGTGNWRVRIDSAALEPRDDERAPYEGHVLSSWYRNGELIEPLGSMSGLPDAFLDAGVAQDCYALWDTASNRWDW